MQNKFFPGLFCTFIHSVGQLAESVRLHKARNKGLNFELSYLEASCEFQNTKYRLFQIFGDMNLAYGKGNWFTMGGVPNWCGMGRGLNHVAP